MMTLSLQNAFPGFSLFMESASLHIATGEKGIAVSSFLLLVVPGPTSSVLAPSSDALCY